MKVIKYKKSLYESFNFDDNLESSNDNSIQNDIDRVAFKNNPNRFILKMIKNLLEFVKNNYGNPKYFKLNHKQMYCVLDNKYSIMLLYSYRFKKEPILKFYSVPDTEISEPGTRMLKCFLKEVSISDNDTQGYDEYIESLENLSSIGFPSLSLTDSGGYISVLTEDEFKIDIKRNGLKNFEFLFDINSILESKKSEIYNEIEHFRQSKALNEKLKEALLKLMNYLQNNNLIEYIGNTFKLDLSFLNNNTIKRYISSLEILDDGLPIGSISYTNYNDRTIPQMMRSFKENLNKFNLNYDYFIGRTYMFQKIKNLINEINLKCE